ncbi:MAG: dihydrodipicolinate synthase family protein [Bordetella sp. SCN 67-23]|nr:dihydrodipicolinate synthase family protein [Burkholderiales bacterium]ODS73310.1 MAG: dihydrodipicolinate synthase family protein [Bordetella sp. SCN 67-23]ODU90417.1 MAG: dihydrodipicolinate synthase family protein [Bordetella sp. SCN 68-11]OJW92840.1 MAG: dihydrodipicolinate synthase family protein [Burkholderiales bacterium 67-32]
MSSAAKDAAQVLRGAFSIVVTPFEREGRLDEGALAANIERTLDLGYDGVLIGGTYGEFATMTLDERARLFRAAAGAVGGRAGLLLCAAGSDPRGVRELTALAGELGGYPMVMPPYVSEVTDAQIVRFFQDIAAEAPGGVVIYNAPGVGITLSVPTLERLADLPGVVGLKQGELNPTVVDQLVGRLGGRLQLLSASDLALTGPATAGFDGLTSTNSCALPELILAAYRALRAGDARTGGALHRSWFAYRELARRHGQPQTVKAAMRGRGWNGGFVRSPLRDLEESARADVESAVRDAMQAFDRYRTTGGIQ